MRSRRRNTSRKPDIDTLSRHGKKLGFVVLSFVVMFAVFYAKDAIFADKYAYTAGTSYDRTVNAESKTQALVPTYTPIRPRQKGTPEKAQNKYVIDGK